MVGRRLPRTIVILAGIIAGGFIVLYFTAVFFGGLIRCNRSDSGGGGENTETVSIYLENNGRHFDIWLPAEYFSLPLSGGQDEGSGWYGFGWGDRDFFLNTPYAADLKAGTLLKALFLPSRAVIAVQYFTDSPAAGASVTEIRTDAASAAAAAVYIESWFSTGLDEAVGVEQISEDDYHRSYSGYAFYQSRGRYSLLFTSNNWISRILREAGLPSGIWTPLVFGVIQDK